MKALIVEDEMLERTALATLLRQYYPTRFETVILAEDGGSAVELARTERPDLIMMDINLPVLNGIEAADQIQQLLPECCIIMASAYSDYEHLRQSMRTRALDYIIKPYSVKTFREAIDRAVEYLIPDSEQYGKQGAVHKAREYMSKHYGEDLTLGDIAEEVSLDRSYLNRIFREETGTTVMAYLKELRLKQAKELLSRGMNVAEVAERTGFGDPAYFGKLFKNHTGVSPARYRREQQELEEPGKE